MAVILILSCVFVSMITWIRVGLCATGVLGTKVSLAVFWDVYGIWFQHCRYAISKGGDVTEWGYSVFGSGGSTCG